MSLSTIGSVADAVTAVLKLITPKTDEIISQDYEKEETDSLAEWQTIMDMPDSITRAQRMHDYISKLCDDNQRPIGSVSGRYFTIPVEGVSSLIGQANDGRKARRYLAAFLKAAGNK